MHGADKRAPDYKAFTHKFDEIVQAEELCDAEELERGGEPREPCFEPAPSGAILRRLGEEARHEGLHREVDLVLLVLPSGLR